MSHCSQNETREEEKNDNQRGTLWIEEWKEETTTPFIPRKAGVADFGQTQKCTTSAPNGHQSQSLLKEGSPTGNQFTQLTSRSWSSHQNSHTRSWSSHITINRSWLQPRDRHCLQAQKIPPTSTLDDIIQQKIYPYSSTEPYIALPSLDTASIKSHI